MSSRPLVTCNCAGRLANQFLQLANVVAYANRFNMDYYVPEHSGGSDEFYFKHLGAPLKTRDVISRIRHTWAERTTPKSALYTDIPRLENVCMEGFFQSYKYIDDQRQAVLDFFRIPYVKNEGVVSCHVRRGDYLQYAANFPPLPRTYYAQCIKYFKDLGYKDYLIFSDDIAWCKQEFPQIDSEVNFKYSEGHTPLMDLELMSNCEHQIIANSSFSWVGAWLNQNPQKTVLCPPDNKMFVGANEKMLPPEWIRINF